MGGLPKKALKESQLEFLTLGSVEDGSHQTYKVTFIENNVKKRAFYKKLAPKKDYPELLAKISVAISLFKRIFQGKRSAEERLVFDEKNRLVGTLSVNVEGFRPFNFSNEKVPEEVNQKELVIPSTKTLIDTNFMEILIGRWFLNDDDGHPHNMSLAGDIDFDMFLYWFTIHMKSPRVLIGIPNTRINLTVEDWEQFPCVKDSKPYHWPTFQHPGKETIQTVIPLQEQLLDKVLPKVYADPTQFQALASEPKAQEQKFAAALKTLLTFQPEMVRARLTELFGDLPLNYTSLDESDSKIRILYEKEFPMLCNKHTNVQSFVDFMMNIYQLHYDNLYRVVVFYMGCDDNGYGVSLPPTYAHLYSKPSFFREVEDWVKNENETTLAKEDKNLRYDEKELLKRYHQIWRDAFAPRLKELIYHSYDLTNKLIRTVSSDVEIKEILNTKEIDNDITSSWQIFGSFPELSKNKIEPLICVDVDSKLREALLLIIDFTNNLYNLSKVYYQKERNKLTEEDNYQFVSQLEELLSKYNLNIRKNLAMTSSLANDFNLISVGLKQFIAQANFPLHLTTTDEQMKEVQLSVISKKELDVDDPEVLKIFNKSLFNWASSLKPQVFNELVQEIIKKHYNALLSNRNRAEPVTKYLSNSMNVSNDCRLSYILCSGKEEGALNTLLIQHLTPIMLQTQYIPSIRAAVKKNTFSNYVPALTKSAVLFAKQEKCFVHLYSEEGMNAFCNLFYSWVDKIDKKRFKRIIEQAIDEYEQGLSSIKYFFLAGNNSRRKEVKGYMSLSSQQKIVAMIFVKGLESSTLNSTLFDTLVNEMKKDIDKNKDLLEKPEWRLFSDYDSCEHKSVFLDKIKKYGVNITQQLETQSSSPFDTII